MTKYKVIQKFCKQCNKEFYPTIRAVSRGQGRFCSRQCYADSIYKGGKTHDSAGYIIIRDRTGKQEREHRIVAAQILGRPLKPNEHVHHINHIKWDNRPENLKILTESEHHSLHNQTTRWAKNYDCCIDCGRTTIKHNAKGLCRTCHTRMIHRKNQFL